MPQPSTARPRPHSFLNRRRPEEYAGAARPRARSFLLPLVLPLCLSACAVNPVSGGKDLVFMSEDQELELGRTLHPRILKQYGGEYENLALRAYVNELGNKLAEKSHRNHLIYHFTVLDSPQINAFALPGGYVYVTRGIMAYMRSEAELAGVIGHEIGHVTARHGVRQHTQGTLVSLLAAVASRAAGNRYLNDLTGLVGTAIVRGYGREHELEADRLGAEYTAKIGHDPEKMLGVLKALKGQEEFEKQLAKEQNRPANVYHGLFATHPQNDERLKEVIAAASRLESAAPLRDDPEVFLRKIEGMTFGASEKEGVVRGSHFYHRDLDITFKFPEKWLISNRPAHVLGRNTADTSFIIFTGEDRNRKETPRQFLARKLKSKARNLRGAPLSGAQLDGYTTVAKVKTPYGTQAARVAVAFFGKSAYMFYAGSRTEGEFAANDALFLQTMNSLRPLHNAERALAKPAAISLLRVKPGDTFASLAAQSGFAHHAEEQLRLLNGMYPGGEPQPGRLIKVVR